MSCLFGSSLSFHNGLFLLSFAAKSDKGQLVITGYRATMKWQRLVRTCPCISRHGKDVQPAFTDWMRTMNGAAWLGSVIAADEGTDALNPAYAFSCCALPFPGGIPETGAIIYLMFKSLPECHDTISAAAYGDPTSAKTCRTIRAGGSVQPLFRRVKQCERNVTRQAGRDLIPVMTSLL